MLSLRKNVSLSLLGVLLASACVQAIRALPAAPLAERMW